MTATTQPTVAVLGAGTMGRGIALTVARGGLDVYLIDRDPEQLANSRAWAERFLAESVKRGKLDEAEAQATLSRIKTVADIRLASSCDIVVEALPEDLQLKRRLLGDIQKHAQGDLIIQSNTSTLPISSIAEKLPNPSRCIGTHYCNPVPMMPLVEVARGSSTDDATVEVTLDFLRRIGKTPVVLKDRPGLITNLLVVAFENDAVRALEVGVGSVEEIDRVVVEGMRFPIGPFRLLDSVGLDIHIAVSESLHEQLRDDQYAVPDTIRAMVERGDLGIKTGRGFYNYEDQS